MYDYIVNFILERHGGSISIKKCNVIRDVNTREEAIRAVKSRYGNGTVRIVSASRIYD